MRGRNEADAQAQLPVCAGTRRRLCVRRLPARPAAYELEQPGVYPPPAGGACRVVVQAACGVGDAADKVVPECHVPRWVEERGSEAHAPDTDAIFRSTTVAPSRHLDHLTPFRPIGFVSNQPWNSGVCAGYFFVRREAVSFLKAWWDQEVPRKNLHRLWEQEALDKLLATPVPCELLARVKLTGSSPQPVACQPALRRPNRQARLGAPVQSRRSPAAHSAHHFRGGEPLRPHPGPLGPDHIPQGPRRLARAARSGANRADECHRSGSEDGGVGTHPLCLIASCMIRQMLQNYAPGRRLDPPLQVRPCLCRNRGLSVNDDAVSVTA